MTNLLNLFPHNKSNWYAILAVLMTCLFSGLNLGAQDSIPGNEAQNADERSAVVQYAESMGVSTATYDEENTYTINTLLMFICAVLVIFMHAGFAMLEAGLNSVHHTGPYPN